MGTLIGTQIGRYRLEEELGGGEITRVYRAFDTRLERQVALKLVLRSQAYSEEFSQRFLGESRALAQLSHPNIVKVLDFGQESGSLFLVMEYIPGKSLQERITRAIPWREAADILLPVADALAYAHDRNVVHSDLKPSNILIDADGQPVLCDFRLSRLFEEEETREMTGTNVGLGSPFYMSPEQGKGLPTDSRADIYALGIIFFELVTGHRPFEEGAAMEVVIHQVTTPPPSPMKYIPDLPEPIERIILTTLKKDPDERFQTMGEWATSVKQVMESGKYRPRPRRRRASLRLLPIILGSLIVLLMGTAALWASGMLDTLVSPPAATDVASVLPQSTIIGTGGKTPSSATNTPQPRPTRTRARPTQAPPTPEPPSISSQFAAYPLQPGRPMPQLSEVISTGNAGLMVEIARLGAPQIHSLAWSPDNRNLIAGTSAGVYIYSAENLKTSGFFDARGWVTAIAISSDGTQAATGANDGMVRLWDLYTGTLKGEFPGHTAAINSLAFSPDAARLVSASQDNSARIWNLNAMSEAPVIMKHSLTVNDAGFTPDGQQVLTVSNDFRAVLWNADTGEQAKIFQSSAMILGMAISSDGELAALALRSANVEIWDIQNQKKVHTLHDPKLVTPIFDVSFSPGGNLLASASGDSYMRIWNVANGSLMHTLPAAANPEDSGIISDQLASVDFSYNGEQLVTRTKAGYLAVWNVSTMEIKASEDKLRADVRKLVISPDNKTLVYQTGSNEINVLDMRSLNTHQTIPGVLPKGDVISQNNRWIVVQDNSLHKVLDIRSPSSGTKAVLYSVPSGSRFAFLSMDNILAAGSTSNVTLWSVASGYELRSAQTVRQKNCQTAYSESGAFLTAGSNNPIVATEADAPLVCAINHNPRALDEDYSPGHSLAYALDNGQVEVWPLVENSTPIRLNTGEKKVLSIAVAPDGTWFAAGSQSGMIYLFNSETGEEILTMDHHHAPVTDIAISPDGKMLITCSEDGSLEIWGILQQE